MNKNRNYKKGLHSNCNEYRLTLFKVFQIIRWIFICFMSHRPNIYWVENRKIKLITYQYVILYSVSLQPHQQHSRCQHPHTLQLYVVWHYTVQCRCCKWCWCWCWCWCWWLRLYILRSLRALKCIIKTMQLLKKHNNFGNEIWTKLLVFFCLASSEHVIFIGLRNS